MTTPSASQSAQSAPTITAVDTDKESLRQIVPTSLFLFLSAPLLAFKEIHTLPPFLYLTLLYPPLTPQSESFFPPTHPSLFPPRNQFIHQSTMHISHHQSKSPKQTQASSKTQRHVISTPPITLNQPRSSQTSTTQRLLSGREAYNIPLSERWQRISWLGKWVLRGRRGMLGGWIWMRSKLVETLVVMVRRMRMGMI